MPSYAFAFWNRNLYYGKLFNVKNIAKRTFFSCAHLQVVYRVWLAISCYTTSIYVEGYIVFVFSFCIYTPPPPSFMKRGIVFVFGLQVRLTVPSVTTKFFKWCISQ